MLSALIGLWALVKGPAAFLFKQVSTWSDHKFELQEAVHQERLAGITARAELAAYQVQSEMNWDMAWIGQSSSSWKDEYLLVLWSIFMWPAVIALPVDMFFGTGFTHSLLLLLGEVQKTVPDILSWWMTGFGIIFAAVYGNKAAGNIMMGSKVSKIAEAFQGLPDEVPDEAVEATTAIIKAKVDRIKARPVKPAPVPR